MISACVNIILIRHLGIFITCFGFISANGQLITAGSNKNYQLGYQRNKGEFRPAMVNTLSNTPIHLVGCGDIFTVAVTRGNTNKFSRRLGKSK